MNEKPSDDLTAIKGIGPVWQKRLRESLGVRTFRDLAALSSDEMLSRLEAKGQIAPPKSECDAWINQAKELTAAAKSSTNTESGEKETGKQMNSAAARNEWKPFASFVVEYLARTEEGKTTEQRRTKVHHVETDTNAKWPRIVAVELCRWMLEQTGEIASTEIERLIEESHARAQHELEQELEEQRAAAQQELQQTLEGEQTRARQALQQEINEERARARKEREQESKQARLELEQKLEEKRSQAQQNLEQELEEKRTQAHLESEQKLEEERSQAQLDLEQELEEKRTQARLESEQKLEEERTQAQLDLEQELEEKRTQARVELDQKLEEERTQAQQDLEPEPLEEEPQPRPEPEEGIDPTAQPSKIRPVVEPYITLAITKLQAYQPAEVAEPVGTGLPRQPFSGLISSGELFSFAVDFELAEPAGSDIVKQEVTYHAQFYAHNISTGSKDHLGDTKATTFVENRSSYIASLADITLESGIYELSVLVEVQNGRLSSNYLIVPLLHVV